MGAVLRDTGNYKDLLAYKKAECVYDVTYYFVNHFLRFGDRTIDQMLQAARSGKQNIAEGVRDSVVSKESEIKLIGVAIGSLAELEEDFNDYMRNRGLAKWSGELLNCAAGQCASHNDSDYYRRAIDGQSDEYVANVALIIIHQTSTLLQRYFERIQRDFLETGGIREQLTRARRQHRGSP